MEIVEVRSKPTAVDHPKHEPVLGSYIYLLALMAAIGGFLFGYDTGIVSSAMLYVPMNDGLAPMTTMWQEVTVSITSGMAGIGALMAARLSDTYGRRKIIILSSMVFTTGALICSVGLSKWILLLGRVLLGVAIGLASMIVPIYVGESSPANIRGKLISGFVLMITFGQMASNLIAEAFSYVDPVNSGWRLMFAFAALPGIVQLIGFLYLPESPRWLYEHRRGSEDCERVLRKVYNGDEKWIRYEMDEIKRTHEEQLADTAVYGNSRSLLGRIFSTKPVRRALFLGCAAQAFQQLAAINTIMYYTGNIIRSAGVRDYHAIIAISVVTSGVNFICTLVPMYLVERVGRRALLIASMAGTIVSLSSMGGAFYLINVHSAKSLSGHLMGQDLLLNHCSSHSNCDYCVSDEHCGFCPIEEIGICMPRGGVHSTHFANPQCSSMAQSLQLTSSNSRNSTEEVYMESTCESRFTALPIVLMVVYLCCYSIGMGPLPWVLNAEFYPLWARSTCVSLATFSNWSFNLLVALTFLSLSQALTKFGVLLGRETSFWNTDNSGVFLLYAAVTTVGLALFYKMLPETKGQSIDEVQHLFTKR